MAPKGDGEGRRVAWGDGRQASTSRAARLPERLQIYDEHIVVARHAARVRAGVDNDLTFMCMYVCMCRQIHFHKCKSMYMYIYYVHFKIICIHERQRRHTFTMHTHTLAPGEAQRFTPSAHSRRHPLHLKRGLPLFLSLSLLSMFLPLSAFYELRNVQFLRLFTSFP